MEKIGILLCTLILSFSPAHSQWELVNSTLGCYSVDFVNDSTGLVCHNQLFGSFILKTVDYGITWDTVAEYPPTVFFTDAVFASDSVAYACGQYNLFLKSIDGGNSWFDPTIGQDPTFDNLLFINDTVGYASGEYSLGKLGVTSDGGLTWSIDEELAGTDLYFEDGCVGGTVTGVTYITTENCGTVWETNNIYSINRDWKTLVIMNTDMIIFGGHGGFGTYFQFNYGTIARTNGDGQPLTILDFPFTDYVNDLFFTDDQTGYAGCDPYSGYQYSILKTEDGGDTWGYQEIDFAPGSESYTGIKEIDCPSPGYCYAVGGGIYRTINGGGEIHEAWVEVGVDSQSIDSPELILVPNPASESIALRSNDLNGRIKISIYNLFGQMVLNQQALFTNSLELPIADLASGQYVVLVESENNILHQKFVKE